MRAVYRALGAAGGIAILSACTGGQSHIEPPFTAATPQNSSLQFRVGTVNFQGVNTFFNTVVTFRQANGLSATLYNSPTITGPAGFTVPSTAVSCGDQPAGGTATAPVSPGPGTDAGTNAISSTQPTQPGTVALATTFGQTGGAFSFGFAPANSTTGGAANYPGRAAGTGFPSRFGTVFNVYPQPIFCSSPANFAAPANVSTSTRRRPYILGPPAVPDFQNGTFPAGFYGYDSGFMSFAIAPVAGSYGLHLTVPSNTIGQLSAVFDLTANLATLVPLPAEPTPVIAEAPAAGGAVQVTVAAAPALVTQQVLYVFNQTQGTFFSFNATAGGTFTVAASKFAAGDTVRAYVAGANWDIIGNSAPNNLSPTPTLPAQTDLTLSNQGTLTYT